MDDELSMIEMIDQAKEEYNVSFDNNSLLRLDQFNIHKVSDAPFEGMRTFVKISFSKDKYDLKGNSHNFLFDYDWEMKVRGENRNIPQSTKQSKI